jgi:hypothetical protein
MIISYPSKQKTVNENLSKKEEKNPKSSKRSFPIFFTGITALCTLLIAIFAICQYSSFKDFSKKNSRAYLSVTNPILDIVDQYNSKDLRVTYTIQNTGKTPAYDVKRTIFFEAQRPLEAVIPDSIKLIDSSKFIYPPGEYQLIKLFKQENFPETGFTPNDTIRYFFTGRIEYVDIFDQSHWLTFAYEYVFRPKRGGTFRQYFIGNRTDKN